MKIKKFTEIKYKWFKTYVYQCVSHEKSQCYTYISSCLLVSQINSIYRTVDIYEREGKSELAK